MLFLRTRLRWLALLLMLRALAPQEARANNEAKIFLTMSSYGVMAGSLTGLASLAFYDHPGDHMRNVAMGASLGLYAGILMSAYMIYAVPDMKNPSKQIDEPSSIDLNGQLERSFMPYVAWDETRNAVAGGFSLRF
ncbi:MAG: hypothetical protein JST16_00185 [Bdellovibrionales bacterium]|nr:hypothetical protein [Bdellovibrionales bacterium]